MLNMFKNSRRNFIAKTAAAVIATLVIPDVVSAVNMPAIAGKKISLDKNDVILFQGDSITDWGRDHTEGPPNTSSALGNGYVYAAGVNLLTQNPTKTLNVYNKGISGNKVYQLAERWDKDCLALKPNVLSIMVGVNDHWHKLNGQYSGTIDTYRDDFKKLLDRTKQALPDVKLIIGEPFAMVGVKFVNQAWYPKFNEFRLVAREVADTYHAAFIPYQNVFDEALKLAPAAYWSLDGVHPTVAGAGLMARAWLETVKG